VSGSSSSVVRQSMAVASKDLRIELRGRFAMNAILPFAGTVLIAFGLSLGPGRTLLQRTAPGLLWLAVLFASVLSFRRAYELEGEDGALEGLVLSTIDPAAVFLGKAGAVVAQLLALELAVSLLVAGLFGLSLGGAPIEALGAALLGTVGLGAVGSLFGVLSESPRARETVFPLLVLPLATPVLVASVKATELASTGRGTEAGSWLGLLAAFDVAFVSIGTLVFEHLMED
jgi:heme exporter protein B